MSPEVDKVDSLKALKDVFNVDPRNEQIHNFASIAFA